MEDQIDEQDFDGRNTKNVLFGLLIGSLAGAVSMLLFAPQAGRKTRARIRQTSSQLRDRTSDMVDNALAQVRSGTHEITAGFREKAGRLKQRGQVKLVEQMDRVSAVLGTGKSSDKDA
jgi:gas vesicle protein